MNFGDFRRELFIEYFSYITVIRQISSYRCISTNLKVKNFYTVFKIYIQTIYFSKSVQKIYFEDVQSSALFKALICLDIG